MIEIDLLGPGPSASAELAERLRARRVGVVSNAFELAPWAEFLAASDRQWWDKYPAAREFAGERYSSHRIAGVHQLAGALTNWNSGVLALAVAAHLGATLVRLHGFDLQGSHFFGPYTNGLTNTAPARREIHKQQFAQWARQHPHVRVVNCTPGSALRCFEFDEQIAA
ncbi:hypothetical protein OCJ37_14285 [Xanthomonas sp. AM6]|uniref:hypothetical protein n=1 Tax=Xanthomonas sp. AM6 TaxID=2982531 RepID=UPI0021D95AA5|nr:hypothetical protein [Xanthomonas sp. AM6]UYB51154.1 hypothetical protein OCJ37_14285 [Xanthomonas sp. AM6]